MIEDKRFDNGNAFDWGNTSSEYAKYRDIYPPIMYSKLTQYGIGLSGQKILDFGTGTGVIPRNLNPTNVEYIATDISRNQIETARRVTSPQSKIQYIVSKAEDVIYPPNSFDCAIACQCFMYFKREIVIDNLYDMLKPNGLFAVLFMAWLPFEDSIAFGSEELVKKYNPNWNGDGYERPSSLSNEWFEDKFVLKDNTNFDVKIPFTRESWDGRIFACRGIGASSLSTEEKNSFKREHMQYLQSNANDKFEILHNIHMIILQSKKSL